MKRWILAFFLVCVMPWALLTVVGKPETVARFTRQTEPVETGARSDLADRAPTEPSGAEGTSVSENALPERTVSVIGNDGTVSTMELESYVLSVVLGEMPTSFEPDALKAQAVVARTFTCRGLLLGVKHENAVCTDPGCCQAFCSAEAYLEQGGTEAGLAKARQAVTATAGQVLLYDGELIEAVYFSCSGGRTEDAAAVWGTDVPYLRSVSSPGEENAAHYVDTVRFSADSFSQALGGALSGDPETWIGAVTYTAGGGVETISIGGQVYSGTELRTALGLRSTVFVITALGNSVTVTTKGYGHRVGMSQYGADAMAVQGSDYTQILSHYYQGTALGNVAQLWV